MAKAAAKTKNAAVKSKASMPARPKAAPPATARKALKKSPAKPAAKSASKVAASKPAPEAGKTGKWGVTFGGGKAEGQARPRQFVGGTRPNTPDLRPIGQA